MAPRAKPKPVAADEGAAATEKPAKRKRASSVSTASTLQARTLYASTRDELREIQSELEEVAEERKKMMEQDTSGRRAVLSLVAPSASK
ncbi:hypothetical protein FI667_g4090, partial [Globisporangium splendens]